MEPDTSTPASDPLVGTDDATARHELVDLLAAFLEALDIPAPATTGGAEVADRILLARAAHVRVTLKSILDPSRRYPADVPWEAGYLRERLAEWPAAGYVTAEEARERMAASASWMEAVALQPEEGRGDV